jgi:hypothetical protein
VRQSALQKAWGKAADQPCTAQGPHSREAALAPVKRKQKAKGKGSQLCHRTALCFVGLLQ